uniref:pyridoxal phosphate-dependent decarboxylase family protein n=1 Tax=Salinibacterium sp. TaxID=1915057 RepID=UPI00286A7E70
MPFDPDEYREALDRAHVHTSAWLASIATRPVRPSATADELEFGIPLPDGPTSAAAVIDELASKAEPGLMAIPSGRFFGWVMGGTLPAALAADWLVSAWDQNAGLRYATPAAAAIEEAAGNWLLDLLHLPTSAAVGFVTGGTTANMVGLAAGLGDVLHKVGWDVNAHGLQGAPQVTVLVGAEGHASVELALRYLGLGLPQLIDADAQGRMRPDALALALAEIDGPVIVALQAGNLHSGAFDPMRDCIEIAHENGAWVHVDGAFGL